MSLIRGVQISGSVASASYALTASYALNGGGGGATFPYIGNAVITGSLVVSGSGTPITTYNSINIQPVGANNTSSIKLGTMTIEHSDSDYSMTLGVNNKPVGTGASALYGLALGYEAGSGSNNANQTTHIGFQAGIQSIGDSAVFIGPNAGQFSTGDLLVALGSGAGANSTGTNAVALGTSAAGYNTKDDIVGIGRQAAYVNTGNSLVAIGQLAGFGNSGVNVIAIGNSAGYSIATNTTNTRSNVTLLGYQASASANNQLVFVRSGSGFVYNAQFDANGISADRKFTLPNSSSIIPLSVNGTGSNSAGDITITNILSSSYAATASLAITYQTSVTTAATASFITSSGVYGPYGSDSITSSSYALTASYALNGGGGGGGTLSYGSFFTDKTTTLASTAGLLDLDGSDISSGISLGTNAIDITTTGIYNFQISVTIQDTNGGDEVDFYLYNTTSNTVQATSAKTVLRSVGGAKQLITWSCLLSLSAGASIALFGASSSGTNVSTILPNNGGHVTTISVIKVA